jgi:hypothetical protein
VIEVIAAVAGTVTSALLSWKFTLLTLPKVFAWFDGVLPYDGGARPPR